MKTFELVVAVTLTFALSGCRLGNHADNGQNGGTPWDGFTGLYESLPNSLQFCAELSIGAGKSKTQCASAATNQIPMDFIALPQFLGNPEAFQIYDASIKKAIIWNFNGGVPTNTSNNWLFAYYTDAKTFNYGGTTTPAAVWNDAACTFKMTLAGSGSLAAYDQVKQVGSLPLSGRMAVSNLVKTEFSLGAGGNCAASFTALDACFQDIAQCGGGPYTAVSDNQVLASYLLLSYIKAGVFTDADVANIRLLSYQVDYQ